MLQVGVEMFLMYLCTYFKSHAICFAFVSKFGLRDEQTVICLGELEKLWYYIYDNIILGVSQNLWKYPCKTVNFSVTSKKLCCIWKSVQFSTCWCFSMLTLVFSMDTLCAFPIACRHQWRTPNTRVRTMHVEHQMENMFLPKIGDAVLGTLRDRQCPSEDCQTSEHSSASKDSHG